MDRILNQQQAIKVSEQLRREGKRIVLAGGCFDILHIGHILFLQKAKQQGDVLFVLLESDESVKKMKGNQRPINIQPIRAETLAQLRSVDYVVTLDGLKADSDYDELVFALKPAIIATTSNDSALEHKKRQAKLVDIEVIEVINRINQASTTKIADLLAKEEI